MKKYPSIEQFRNVVKAVRLQHDYKGKDDEGKAIYSHTSTYPTLRFRGSVKLHGTNAAIVLYKDGHIEFQSRERVLTLEEDNAGFMKAFYDADLSWIKHIAPKFTDYIAIYGEWCGKGIQKGVGIAELPKKFVIFDVKIDDVWLNELPSGLTNVIDTPNIAFINHFNEYFINIDFNNPELSQNKLIEWTMEVENECPVAKYYGVSGIGEGIVFTCTTNPEWKFKSKGEKHSVTKVKVLNSIDTEQLNSINEFVESVVTENRLKQGITYFNENNIEVDSKNTGQFLSWVVRDVLKEESDTIINNGFDDKKVKHAITTKARVWFLNNI